MFPPQAILSELKLSGEGKKADLVARILEHQGASSGTTGDAGASTSAPAESTPAVPASSSEEAAAVSGGAVTSTAGLSAVEGKADNDTNSTAITGSGETDKAAETKEEQPALPLPAGTDKNDEAERRLNRLKRFGNPEDIAKLERMEKFGTKGDVVNEKVSVMVTRARLHYPAIDPGLRVAVTCIGRRLAC